MKEINEFILEYIFLPSAMVAWAVFMSGVTWSTVAGWVRQWREKEAKKVKPEDEAK